MTDIEILDGTIRLYNATVEVSAKLVNLLTPKQVDIYMNRKVKYGDKKYTLFELNLRNMRDFVRFASDFLKRYGNDPR